jgi:hypothetical protein
MPTNSNQEDDAVMRFVKLIPAVAALTVALAIAPPGASAFKHPSPNGRCRVNLFVAPRIIATGDTDTIWGQLSCQRPISVANRVVRLFEHLRGTPGLTFVQRATTNVNGFYEIEQAAGAVTTNRWYVVRSLGAQSRRKGVRVEAEVNLAGPPEGTTIYTGPKNAVTFTGNVNPPDTGAVAILQRQNAVTGNEWHGIDRAIVQADGSFSITHTFRYPGDADIRVLVRSQDRNIPSRSNVLTYEISQAQNPGLTISSSADPITFGQSVMIGGTLLGGAAQRVTLYARTVGQRFAAIAESTTNTEGDYAFPAQSPMNSTFYRVEGNSKHSAVLFEGVRSLLTAAVSRTTVQAGMPVTFSGAVAPDRSGEIVYLERKNAAGPGYHVIQVATIGAGSTYSIEHRFYDPGTKVVRIYVPGGPQNSAAASPPFTIEVTPAPVSALTPEALTNISLPSEGEGSGSNRNESASGGLEAVPGETEPGTESKERGKPTNTPTTETGPAMPKHHHLHEAG